MAANGGANYCYAVARPRPLRQGLIGTDKEDRTMNVYEEMQRTFEGLLQQRDELLVQLHLAKLEARQEWEKTEAQLDDLKFKLDSATREARDSGDEVWASVKVVGEEIKDAYDRIKQTLTG
jgi:uncharacterized protein (DUF342 family)